MTLNSSCSYPCIHSQIYRHRLQRELDQLDELPHWISLSVETLPIPLARVPTGSSWTFSPAALPPQPLLHFLDLLHCLSHLHTLLLCSWSWHFLPFGCPGTYSPQGAVWLTSSFAFRFCPFIKLWNQRHLPGSLPTWCTSSYLCLHFVCVCARVLVPAPSLWRDTMMSKVTMIRESS